MWATHNKQINKDRTLRAPIITGIMCFEASAYDPKPTKWKTT